MINPSMTYKSRKTAVLTKIESRNSYIDKFEVEFSNGNTYQGYVSDIKNFSRFKVGDSVKVGVEFSITLDKFLVKTLRRAA